MKRLLLSFIAVGITAASLFAQGNVIFTGRDLDYYAGAPSFFNAPQAIADAKTELAVVVAATRNGSHLPLLILARPGLTFDQPPQSFLVVAMDNIGIHACPDIANPTDCYIWIDISNSALPVLSPAFYSAVGVASASSGVNNGDNTTADIATILAAGPSISNFVAQGGGLFVLAGKSHADYYSFLTTPAAPTLPLSGANALVPIFPVAPGTPGPHPTAYGASLGLIAAPGTFGHNLFNPAVNWQVLETFSGSVDNGNTVTNAPLTVGYFGPSLVAATPQTLSGTVGVALANQTLSASGGAPLYTWRLSGAPAWVAVDASGHLTGTPPAAGAYAFTATIHDSGTILVQTGQVAVTINVAPPPLVVPVTQSFTGTSGVALTNQALTASGGTAPYTWRATGQPTWLTVSSTGALSGTPPTSGTFSFQATIVDGSPSPQSGQTTATLRVVAPPLVVPNPQTFTTFDGQLSGQLSASGGTSPYTWQATGAPSWIVVGANGQLSGVAPATGTVSFTATIADSTSPQKTAQITVSVNVPVTLLTLPSGQTVSATAAVPFSQQLSATGGAPPLTWHLVSGPAWLSVSTAGVLSGTPPTVAGSAPTTYNFSVGVIDSGTGETQQSAQASGTVVAAVYMPTGITVTLTPAQPAPTDQPKVSVTATNATSTSLAGFLTLTGPADARFLSSNPTFISTNGKTLCFNIPATSSGTVTLDDSGLYMLGTVAGAVSVELASISIGACPLGSETNLIAGNTVTQSQTVPRSVPIISAVTATGTAAAGITITMTGFSNTQDLSSAAFTFTAPAGTQVNGAQQSVQLSPTAVTYYSTAANGAFEYVQAFPYSGAAKAFPTAVAITVTNSVGASASASATIAP